MSNDEDSEQSIDDQSGSQQTTEDENQGQQTTDDQSASQATESDQQTSQDQVTDESAGQTTDDQSQTQQTADDQGVGQQTTDDAGVAQTDDECAGWFSDRESTSKRAAEHYVRTELTGNRGVVEKIECVGPPDGSQYTCHVHFSDKTTTIDVFVRRDRIVVGEDPPGFPPPDRLVCWYDYKCPPPNRDLVLTKRECEMTFLCPTMADANKYNP